MALPETKSSIGTLFINSTDEISVARYTADTPHRIRSAWTLYALYSAPQITDIFLLKHVKNSGTGLIIDYYPINLETFRVNDKLLMEHTRESLTNLSKFTVSDEPPAVTPSYHCSLSQGMITISTQNPSGIPYNFEWVKGLVTSKIISNISIRKSNISVMHELLNELVKINGVKIIID